MLCAVNFEYCRHDKVDSKKNFWILVLCWSCFVEEAVMSCGVKCWQKLIYVAPEDKTWIRDRLQ